ncbi:ATP-binding protein [Yinghuangia sp. YIM S09857]|uniref:ATP-binding protein n=1 Tax=Yinghuangia sp. YIM S09857 TaxID=3436929 RepID=UPI003F53536E
MAATSGRERRRGNLPADVTEFIGRRAELAHARQSLTQTRMLTLVGPGGVGKTRLGLTIAAESGRAFQDGVWLVELASLNDGALLARTVAAAMGMQDATPGAGAAALREHLAHKHVLLVLDNCEHLLQECAVLATDLLRDLPGVRLLATSRQPLGITGERVMPVPPLSLPSNGDPTSRSEAVDLFEARAAAVQPEFRVTTRNRDTVLGVCRRLDGIPLAIELAAVRLRALSLDDLHARLDDRFALLTTGSRTATSRQQTLRAAVDWSYDLCTPRERLFWAHASVFSGDFDLDAAQSVCAGDGIEEQQTLELVASLIDQSILLRLPDPAPHARYRMLETLRQYGLERLVETGRDRWQRGRHRDYYMDVAATAEREFPGPGQVRWHQRLRAELPDIRSAIDFSLESPSASGDALAFAASIKDYWLGLALGEAGHWLGRGLEAHPTGDAVRVKGLWAAAWVASLQGDLAAATEMLSEAQVIAETTHDVPGQAHVARVSGITALYHGDAARARPLLAEALRGHRTAGDDGAIVLTLFYLGLEASWRGDDEARDFCEQALAICDRRGMAWSKAYLLWLAGYEEWRRRLLPRAAELVTESLKSHRTVQDRRGYALGTEALAWISTAQGDHERGARLLGCARSLWTLTRTSLAGLTHLIGYHQDCESELRKALGDARFTEIYRSGTHMSAGEAVAYALREGPVRGGPEPAEQSRHTPLTRRETQIAALVAEGKSNREIAEQLVISPRTAETHVEHILTKLGFTSRTQVASWIASTTEHEG